LPRKGCSRGFGGRGFAEVRQDEERGGTLEKNKAGAKKPRPSAFPLEGALKGLWLRVLGPYLALDLLDEGLAILILLLVLADRPVSIPKNSDARGVRRAIPCLRWSRR
jgi:hypothetical protein